MLIFWKPSGSFPSLQAFLACISAWDTVSLTSLNYWKISLFIGGMQKVSLNCLIQPDRKQHTFSCFEKVI